MKRVLTFLINGPRICRLPAATKDSISSGLSLLSQKLPSDFARQPRSLDELSYWKATEFRQFLLYTGPLVLKNIVPKKVYDIFLVLHVAMSILLTDDDGKRNHFLDYARNLTQYFVANAKHVFGETFSVYNVHSLIHLADDVEHFNCSLNQLSAFPFENFLQQIKKCIKSAHNPIAQVCCRLASPRILIKSGKKYKICKRFRDSWFILGSGKIWVFLGEFFWVGFLMPTLPKTQRNTAK